MNSVSGTVVISDVSTVEEIRRTKARSGDPGIWCQADTWVINCHTKGTDGVLQFWHQCIFSKYEILCRYIDDVKIGEV